MQFSALDTDHGLLAARPGVGVVMSSKKLKAIVVKGTNSLSINNPEGFVETLSRFPRLVPFPGPWKCSSEGTLLKRT